MSYNAEKDMLLPTDDLMHGDSELLKSIASRVKDWVGNWDAIWENIMLRAKVKQTIVDYAIKTKNDELLEAPFVISSNDQFHRISDEVKTELGVLDTKQIYFRWEEWLKRQIKKKGL